MHEREILKKKLSLLTYAASLLNIPLYLTEQYPEGLGKTILELNPHKSYTKTAFSCLGALKEDLATPYWIVAGIESHVCVLQTVRDLIKSGKQVVVLQDAIASRSLLDHTSALQEMRAMNARITTVETLLFELLQDAKHPQFKAISQAVK